MRVIQLQVHQWKKNYWTHLPPRRSARVNRWGPPRWGGGNSVGGQRRNMSRILKMSDIRNVWYLELVPTDRSFAVFVSGTSSFVKRTFPDDFPIEFSINKRWAVIPQVLIPDNGEPFTNQQKSVIETSVTTFISSVWNAKDDRGTVLSTFDDVKVTKLKYKQVASKNKQFTITEGYPMFCDSQEFQLSLHFGLETWTDTYRKKRKEKANSLIKYLTC